MLFFALFNKTIMEQTEGFCSLSCNSAPNWFISSIYNLVLTKLEGGNINQFHLKSQQRLSQFNVCIELVYLRNPLTFG